MHHDFYVYVLLDPRRPGRFSYGQFSFLFEPFYVGKGRGKRLAKALSRHGHCRNRIIAIQREGLAHHAMRIADGLSEDGAFDFEKDAIQAIGRRIRHTGPLVNQQRGGSGVSRRNPRPPTTEQVREKIRRSLTGRTLPDAVKEKLRGKPAWNRGKEASAEQRQKMSAAKSGRPAHNKGVSMSPDKYVKCAATMFKTGEPSPNKGKRLAPLTEQQKAARRAYRHTEEALAKIRAACAQRKGRKRTPEIGAKISAAKKGKPNHKARGVPRPPHVVAAMQAGVAKWRHEQRLLKAAA